MYKSEGLVELPEEFPKMMREVFTPKEIFMMIDIFITTLNEKNTPFDRDAIMPILARFLVVLPKKYLLEVQAHYGKQGLNLTMTDGTHLINESHKIVANIMKVGSNK